MIVKYFKCRSQNGALLAVPDKYPEQPGLKNGVYEIGIRSDGVIDHRFFRPNK